MQGLEATVADWGMWDDTYRFVAQRDPEFLRLNVNFQSLETLRADLLLICDAGGKLVLGRIRDAAAQELTPVPQALADQASVSVHFTSLREALEAKQRLDRDLEAARRIQEMLLPKELPRIEGVELAAFNDPAFEIGGDYYDCLRVGEHHLGLAIADVSGKGIGGAIMMSVCRSILRAEAPRHTGPGAVLRRLNEILSPDVTEDMFVSLVYMVLDLRTRELTVARAGHERPLWWRARDGELRVLDSPGIGVGIAGDAFDRALREDNIQLEKGDVVVAYTDGITEALNAAGEEWGQGRLFETLKQAAPEGAHSVLTNVRQRVERFVGQRPQYDDMTLLALRVMG